MPIIESRLNTRSEVYRRNLDTMTRLMDEFRALELRAVTQSGKARARFEREGKLLPRERLTSLLDPGSPFLELMTLAGYCGIENPDPATSIPGSAVIAGIGHVADALSIVVVNDSGIDAGAMQSLTGRKIMRCQEIALENRLPFIQLVESAGGNLKKYRVERFLNGGGMFYNLARLSAAGIPVLSVVHGSSTAGGAYLPGLSDYVVMVRGQSRAFLAGPPLLRAATGEIATEEELGGAEMHATVSGLADYVSDDDCSAIMQARSIMRSVGWRALTGATDVKPPRYDPKELYGLMSADYRIPVEMREVIARIVDDSGFHEFKQAYGPQTVCGYAAINGVMVGIITNNGPLDPAGTMKAAEFIQLCAQLDRPIIYLQNITGFVVGREHEQAGMIKHGAKLIQALSNVMVPQVTIMCGASFGAGNYGMCGRAFHPRFLFSWPNARTAVMGGEQAAMTMRMVAEASAKRKGVEVDTAWLDAESREIIVNFDSQSSAIVTSSLILDDGVIDPAHTRAVLSMAFAACTAARRPLSPIQFGVARF